MFQEPTVFMKKEKILNRKKKDDTKWLLKFERGVQLKIFFTFSTM